MYWSDCLACEDEPLYRVTTSQPSGSACVTAAECENTDINAFGDRTCSSLNVSVSFIFII